MGGGTRSSRGGAPHASNCIVVLYRAHHMEPPPESTDVDFSEVFAGDKIAFNTQKLNYWCACPSRSTAVPVLIPLASSASLSPLSTTALPRCAVKCSWPSSAGVWRVFWG